MADDCIVIIGQAEVLPALRARAGSAGETLVFGDAEPVAALQAILTRRPAAVVIDRTFAATPRGVALINRIKADSTLAGSEIRVVAHDSDYSRVVKRADATQTVDAPVTTAAAVPVGAPASPQPAPTLQGPAQAPTAPLDQKGTRRTPRQRLREGVELQLDGNPAAIVDLSPDGAQVISQTILRPNQRVRVLLPVEPEALRFGGAIAWASFEMSRTPGVPQYRAGVEFVDADARAVEAFCVRHRSS